MESQRSWRSNSRVDSGVRTAMDGGRTGAIRLMVGEMIGMSRLRSQPIGYALQPPMQKREAKYAHLFP